MQFIHTKSHRVYLMELKRLTAADNTATFNCGDEDLNGFLTEDAMPSAEKHIANTFVLYVDNEIAAYFCLLTDKITKLEDTRGRFSCIIF